MTGWSAKAPAFVLNVLYYGALVIAAYGALWWADHRLPGWAGIVLFLVVFVGTGTRIINHNDDRLRADARGRG
jgi:hypothetical protein